MIRVSNRTYFGLRSVLQGLLITVLFIASGSAIAQKRPNILLVMTDDQGTGDLGVHGNPDLKTPFIDAFAKESTELSQFIVNFNCSPTRASLLTGRDSYRTGVVGVTESTHLMKASEITLAKILADAGYRTGIFGKWHLGDNYPMRPTDKGFQEALVHKGGGIGQAAGPPGNSYYNPVLEHNNVSKRYDGYCDDIFTDAAIGFMEQKSDQPFFIYLATNLPHFPLDISDERADPYRKLGIHELNARTYGMIANVDANFGRLMDKLKALGMADNTIVIFMSDNGPRTKRTKNDVYPDRYNMNLRGTKTSVYENGIRSPFFIRWPGKIEAGKKLDRMAAHIDVLPTLLDAARVTIPAHLKINGISLMPLLRSEVDTLPEREIYLQGHHGPEPVRYIHFTVRTQRYKLISPHDNPYGPIAQPSPEEINRIIASLELYDIENDPSEIRNIARQHPDIVADLLAKYERWFDDAIRERGNDWPQKIYAGTEFQPVVQLSRFDWGGPQAFTTAPRLGYWDIRTEAGSYRIKATFPKTAKAAVAYLRYQGMELRQPVSAGASEITFEEVKLPGTTGKLELFVRSDRADSGVQFVDIEFLK